MPGLFDFRSIGVSRDEAEAIVEDAKPPERQWFSYAVPGERTRDVTYTNDTGQEILLDVQTTSSSSTSWLAVMIDESVELRTGSIGSLLGHRQSKTTTVPAGSTYRVTGRDPATWSEFRPSR